MTGAQVRAMGVANLACEPRVRTARYARQNAYHRRVPGCALWQDRALRRVTIAREALREPGPALPAGAAHIVDTRVDTD